MYMFIFGNRPGYMNMFSFLYMKFGYSVAFIFAVIVLMTINTFMYTLWY